MHPSVGCTVKNMTADRSLRYIAMQRKFHCDLLEISVNCHVVDRSVLLQHFNPLNMCNDRKMRSANVEALLYGITDLNLDQ